ncbi:hypothetical protein SDC9_08002 [bioreactor metagenome]|uniref:Type 4 prepilin-like proteins leader peptide-processing enzyme n=1 Tax=bioreactor metagenome TaxID=1076179 RepID=A0A644T871_9ZZZZ|nr:prepilin peptidase [Candidatus Elulimicrobiales bacterium]
MNIILYIFLFFIGAALGSFVGVVVDRLYIKSYIKGGSICQSCAKKLTWFETIPVLSYLFLGGKCRKCKTKIGAEHFWIEVAGGVFAILAYQVFLKDYFISGSEKSLILGIVLAFFFALLFIVFGVIFNYDLKNKLVPTNYALILIVIGLAFEAYKAFNYQAVYGGLTTLFWLDLFSGFLIALPFFLIYIFSKKKAVGFGDILIYFGVGYLAGFVFGLSIFLVSVWMGAIISLILLYLRPKKYHKKSQIPFAPFIILATIIVMFLQLDIIGMSSLFF